MSLDLACKRKPVHLGHLHVQDHDVEAIARLDQRADAPPPAAIPHARTCLLTISRFVAWSSTKQAPAAQEPAPFRRRDPGHVSLVGRDRQVERRAHPPLSTHIVPPISSTSRFETSPSPVPP